MERNRWRWQGLGFTLLGVLFLVITSVLYTLHRLKDGSLPVFLGVSAFLVVIGAVMFVISRRIPQNQTAKNKRRKQ